MEDPNDVMETLSASEQALVGKPLWKVALERGALGRPRTFESPEEFLQAAMGYFRWAELNPLYEVQAHAYQGDVTKTKMPKLRAWTVDGLCLFTGIDDTTLCRWRKEPEFENFRNVVSIVDKALRDQKFAGAAAGLLNASIISRDLGLKDASEISGPKGGAIPVAAAGVSFVTNDPVAASQAYAALMGGDDGSNG